MASSRQRKLNHDIKALVSAAEALDHAATSLRYAEGTVDGLPAPTYTGATTLKQQANELREQARIIASLMPVLTEAWAEVLAR